MTKHWHLRIDTEGVAWLSLDTAGASMNKLSAEVLAEFSEYLNGFDAHPPGSSLNRQNHPDLLRAQILKSSSSSTLLKKRAN